jgi:diphthine-ammonia ligase
MPLIAAETQRIGEDESLDLIQVLQKAKEQYNIEGLVNGGLISRYQKARFERACNQVGLGLISPIWQTDPETYMHSLLQSQFHIIVVAVAAEGLTEEWLGRSLDKPMILRLKDLNHRLGVHIAFEGGEAETFVLDCPLFTQQIKILNSTSHWHGDHGLLEINDACLVAKSPLSQKS